MQRLFDAMLAADSAAVRRLFHPQARLLVPGAAEGRPAVSVTSLEEFVLAVANSNRRYDERMRDPEVRVDAHLATLWAPYEFHLAGELSHCGVDAFQLARAAEGWQILQVAYTRRTACR